MIDIRPGKSIRRVILLTTDAAGTITPATLYRKRKRKKKKGTLGVRQLGRVVQAGAEAQQAFSDVLVQRHKRSNRKRKDGWLRDLGQNVYKASDKGLRKLIKGAGM